MNKHFGFRLALCAAIAASFLATVGNADESKNEDTTQTETTEIKVKDITLVIPKSWKQKPPANRLRLAQFELPLSKGDDEQVELTIFSFGGGGVDANVRRWINQFHTKGRKASIKTGKSPQGTYVFVDISGTYNKPVGPPIQRKTKVVENARMLAVILAVKGKGVYYLKLAGQQKTVAAAVVALRKSFGANSKEEKAIDFESGK